MVGFSIIIIELIDSLGKQGNKLHIGLRISSRTVFCQRLVQGSGWFEIGKVKEAKIAAYLLAKQGCSQFGEV